MDPKNLSSALGKKPDEDNKALGATDAGKSTTTAGAVKEPVTQPVQQTNDEQGKAADGNQQVVDPNKPLDVATLTGAVESLTVKTEASAWQDPGFNLAPAPGSAAEPVQTRSRAKPLTEAEADARDRGEIEVAAPTPYSAYKHRGVRHFKVADFEFRNHVLYLYSKKADDEFLDLYDTLPDRDKNDIVVYDFEAARRVETPVAVSRGSMSTSAMKDPKVVSA